VEQTHIRAIASGSSFVIYENPNALPVAAFEKSPMIAVPIEYHANRIRIHTANETGTVFLRIAPIAGYQTRIASGSQPPLTLTESGILLSVQQTQEFVDVVYRSGAFDRGVLFALTTIALGAMGFVFSKKRLSL
jgi:hypothetical protein